MNSTHLPGHFCWTTWTFLMLSCIVMMNRLKLVSGDFTCYSGILTSSTDGTLPIDSSQHLTIQECAELPIATTTPATREPTTQMKTTNGTSSNATSAATVTSSNVTSTVATTIVSANVNRSRNATTSPAANVTATSPGYFTIKVNTTQPNSTKTPSLDATDGTTPTTGAPSTAGAASTAGAPSTASPTSAKPSSSTVKMPVTTGPQPTISPVTGRKRRGATGDDQAGCVVTQSFSGSNVTRNTTWTATFSCASAASPCNQTHEGANKTYCCEGSRCNSINFFMETENVSYTPVSSCYVGSTDVKKTKCEDSIFCVTTTQDGSDGGIEYACGDTNIQKLCLEDEALRTGCFNDTVNKVCCCASDNCNEKADVHPATSGHSNTTLIAGVVMAFVIGLFGGIVITVVVCRRKKRTNANVGELLTFDNFRYKRMGADEVSEEVFMS